MSRVLTVLLLLCGACGGDARSADRSPPSSRAVRQFDYRGIHLGDSLTPALVQTKGLLRCDAEGCSGAQDSLGGVETTTFLGTANGRIFNVVITFPSEGFRTVEQAATAKWGPPATEPTDTLTTRIGAKFPRQRRSWHFAEGTLHLDQMSDRVTEGVLMIVSDSLARVETSQDSARAERDGKSKL